MNHWLLLGLAITSEVIGTTFLKSSEGLTRLVPSVIVVASYVISFYLLSLVLKTMPIGIAYAIWAGVGVAAITLVGWWFFDNPLDGAAILGIVLIVAGVVVINSFSASVSSGTH